MTSVEVSRITSTAGRCFKCHKFRYCDYQTKENIICKDCVQTLKNQRLLVEVTPQIIKSSPKLPRKKKPIKPKNLEPRSVRSKKKMLDCIKSSEKALTAKELIESYQLGRKTTVYKILSRLVKCGDIIGSPDKAKNRAFIDKDRVHLLQARQPVRQNEYAKLNRTRVLNYVKRENRILEIADVVNATNITKKTVIRVVNFLEETGDLACIKASERGNKLHFVPTSNALLVQQLKELDQLSTPNRARRILESKSNRGISIGDTLAALGKNRRNGSYKYIKKLFEQWGCKTYRKGCGLYYYLDKEGSYDQ